MTTAAILDAPGAPTELEVRAALERIVASEGFRTSPQLGTFLHYIVEETLSGLGAGLKGYTIGVEALGRDSRFDPQIDPIVRVEATRLRRAMERYYAGDGGGDPVVIELQRGNYVPTFSRRAPMPAAASAVLRQAKSLALLQRLSHPLAVAGILTVVAIGLAAAILVPHGESGTRSPTATGGIEARPAASQLPPGNGMPTIYVEPLHVGGAPGANNIAARSLAERIRDAFARFDMVNVAFATNSTDTRTSDSPATTPPRADYRLSGSAEYGETVTTILFQLTDTADGTIVWSRAFERSGAAIDQVAADEDIVVVLTNTLLQPYGVIHSRERAKRLASAAGDPRYRCVLETFDYVRSYDPAEHDRARSCLEHLASIDPSFSVGFELLAAVYNREYAMALGMRPGDPPALDRALRAARRAIELNPTGARGYLILFVVLYSRHDLAAAFAAGEKAMEFNKYDTLAIAEYGGRLIMTGEVKRGLALVRQAGDSGGIRPSWHHFYLFLGCYLGGDTKEAAFHADQISTDFPLGLVAQAITASKAGDEKQTRRAIDRLLKLQPTWRNNARGLLERFIYKPEIVDRLLRDLAAAGLPAKS